MISNKHKSNGVLRLFCRTVLITLIAVCSACMAGGTSGTGLGAGIGFGGTSGTGITKGQASFLVRGRVLNQRGRPMPDVRISASTSKGTQVGRTDARGEFEIPLERGKVEPISLHFEAGGLYGDIVLKPYFGSVEQKNDYILNDDGSMELH